MFRFVLSPGTNSNHCHEGVLLRGTLDNLITVISQHTPHFKLLTV